MDVAKLAQRGAGRHNRAMYTSAVPRIARLASGASELYVGERDTQGVAIPSPEVLLVVRFGPSTRSGVDIHAIGGRERVHRKQLRGGQRIVTARLRLDAANAVLGVPASAVAGSIVALEDLWGAPSTRRLLERFVGARDLLEAASILESAISARSAFADGQRARPPFVLAAADRLGSGNASVNAIASDLGVSERHLRRVFREIVGLSPKTFAKVTRFRQALRAARKENHASWATIALDAGYYDQAHLISEFRTIAGVTPRALVGELRTAQALG
ncbi:MAG TPA: helix-turn-helix transcriptional regulator [Polyangiaceae bacterium]|nr:helix-turn-helix transcriptional regulator [Polyangiaceae bacterium]